MKIPANSFGLDMNALLNAMNDQSNKGYYNRMIHKTRDRVKKIQDRIQSGKMNTEQIAEGIRQQIKILKQNDKNMLDHSMPEAIGRAMNKTLEEVPTNTTYYYPPNQRPSDPTPGDVVWHIPDPQDFGSNHVKASAERYTKDAGWQPIKGANQDVFGANILGANIKGGEITGATFRLNAQSNYGAPFSVRDDGRVYATNFVCNLMHAETKDSRQVNPCNYIGTLANGHGFSLTGGILTMGADVTQERGERIWSDNPAVVGNTYLEPGYLKLRYNRGDNNFVRSDLRGGELEITGNDWGHYHVGVKLGYWSPDLYPKIQLGDWLMHESNQGSGNFHLASVNNSGIIQLDGPVSVNGTLWAGDGKRLAKGSDIGRILASHRDRINTNQADISDHGNILKQHGSKLSAHDKRFVADELKIAENKTKSQAHDDKLAYHEGWLHKHDKHLSNHDDKLAYHEGWLHRHDNQFSSDEAKVAYDEGTLHQHNTTLQNHTDKLAYHEGWLHKHDSKFDTDETTINSHTDKLNNHEGRIQTAQTDINDLTNTVNNRLDIAEGEGGDVSFKDLTSGHFTFHNSISILNDRHAYNSLSIGGYNGSSSTQLWDDHMFSNEIQTDRIMLGPNHGYELTTTDYGGMLMYHNKPIATRDYADGHGPSGVSKSTVKSMIKNSNHGVSSSTVQSMINNSMPSVTRDWVRGTIAWHIKYYVKNRYLKNNP